ncbi:MAG: amidophosphoribosyltransferase [Spirochaetaceae bacterium]|jgi:amidophosphoribosyltransferase|nr:amidophosphoribosyltransferase [Spirochaetaceae bacterium]
MKQGQFTPNAVTDDDKLRESCGVIGIFLQNGEDMAARLGYYGLYSLQHRGQESAGISVSDGTEITTHKGMGLVSEVFNEEKLNSIKGRIAVGHVLYSTSGKAYIENAQPFVIHFKLGNLAVAHNGSLVNTGVLKELLEETGSTFSSSSDSEVIIKLIAKNYKKGLERALTDTIQMIKGSFALAVMTENTLIGVRDPNGIRPLCLGKLENGWVIASESCAIDAIGGELVRDIEPGEIVIINDDGVLSFEFGERTAKKTCIFEYVYFARPDSILDGIAVQEARLRMGAILARESAVPADVVIGVPDSGLGAAMGFSAAVGIPYAMGIVKNKYIGRTFIAPSQEQRENLVFVKLNAMKSDINGKRVIIIDDSIVRGTTSRRLIQILRRAGAKEVHFRISSPPVKFSCYFGIDTPCRSELISSSHDEQEICKAIGADSLAFISIKGMLEALGGVAEQVSCEKNRDGQDGYCQGCFTGEYPMPSPGEIVSRRL